MQTHSSSLALLALVSTCYSFPSDLCQGSRLVDDELRRYMIDRLDHSRRRWWTASNEKHIPYHQFPHFEQCFLALAMSSHGSCFAEVTLDQRPETRHVLVGFSEDLFRPQSKWLRLGSAASHTLTSPFSHLDVRKPFPSRRVSET